MSKTYVSGDSDSDEEWDEDVEEKEEHEHEPAPATTNDELKEENKTLKSRGNALSAQLEEYQSKISKKDRRCYYINANEKKVKMNLEQYIDEDQVESWSMSIYVPHNSIYNMFICVQCFKQRIGSNLKEKHLLNFMATPPVFGYGMKMQESMKLFVNQHMFKN